VTFLPQVHLSLVFTQKLLIGRANLADHLEDLRQEIILDRRRTERGHTEDRKRTYRGQTEDRHRTDIGQTEDRHRTDIGHT